MLSRFGTLRIRNCKFLIKKPKIHIVECTNKSKNLRIPAVLFGLYYRKEKGISLFVLYN